MKVKNRHKKNISIFITWILGPILFCWVCWSIYKQIQQQPGIANTWQHISNSTETGRFLINLLVVCVLMLVNWGIEAAKWKLAVEKIQSLSYFTAYKAVLSGVSFSVTTPNRVGEYLGRVLYMDEGNRMRAVSLTITGSLSQLIITLLMGFCGLCFLHEALAGQAVMTSWWLDMIRYGALAALVLLTLFYFRLSWLAKWIDRLPAARRFAWLIRALEQFNATLLLQLLSLSALRFAVFIVQYYLLFLVFDVQLSWWQCLWAVSVSFLVMAAIPTIALFTDLGLRGTVSLTLIGLFSSNQLGIGLTSVSIWFINLIIPALAGSLLILSVRRLFKDKKEKQEVPAPEAVKDKLVSDEWNN